MSIGMREEKKNSGENFNPMFIRWSDKDLLVILKDCLKRRRKGCIPSSLLTSMTTQW